MPKEPRRVPTVLGRVHQRITPRPSGSVFLLPITLIVACTLFSSISATIAIPTYGACTALALLSALAVSVSCAQAGRTERGEGLESRADRDSDGADCVAAARDRGSSSYISKPSILAARSADAAETFGLLWAALAGVLAAMLYALAEGLPLLRTADARLPPWPWRSASIAWARSAAASAWGTPTHLPWGVVYRSPVAYLWYRVPLGVPLHPVQFYDALASPRAVRFLLWMARVGSRRDGESRAPGCFSME